MKNHAQPVLISHDPYARSAGRLHQLAAKLFEHRRWWIVLILDNPIVHIHRRSALGRSTALPYALAQSFFRIHSAGDFSRFAAAHVDFPLNMLTPQMLGGHGP
jgi:hypothetical protein